MVIVGVNEDRTENGFTLHDGGCVILREGKILGAISEERVTRKKREGGYRATFSVLSTYLGIDQEQIDLIVTSSCCAEEKCHPFLVPGYQDVRIESCNHHLSHAYSAFYTSPFDEAIVIVIDAGGNTLDNNSSSKWWHCKREQHSYYLASKDGILLIGRDFDGAEDAGIGEIYRAFTYYLGWPSSRFSGNTMALAGYGDISRFKGSKIFSEDNGDLQSAITNTPDRPIEMVGKLLNELGIEAAPRQCSENFLKDHYDLAAWVQSEVEDTLINLVNRLIVKTGIRKICMAGGVAYNCRAAYSILRNSKAEDVFVGPASGDQGQALGNAIYGDKLLGKNSRKVAVLPPLLGPAQNTKHKAIVATIEFLDLPLIAKKSENITNDTASLLVKGMIVGWFQGRSEFGPRALGNRSILASPSINGIKERLNVIKGRDYFMPLAPATLEEESSKYFSSGGTAHMSVAVRVNHLDKCWIKNIAHVDGSSRVQIVRREDNPRFHDLISQFYGKTDIPMVLNTSFNGSGEPIVESIADALEAFCRMELDHLVINETIISKKNEARLAKFVICNEVSGRGAVGDIAQAIEEMTPNISKAPRNRFLLFDEYIQWLEAGRKITTIRYRKDAIDYPVSLSLPLLATEDYSQQYSCVAGRAVIKRYEIKPFGQLSEKDARNDGFLTLSELRTTLQEIYGPINNEELVSIYLISFNSSHCLS